MRRIQKRVRGLVTKLNSAPVVRFPDNGSRLDAPNKQGVYIIYSPSGRVLHVGQTPRGANGLRQRLSNHLHARSSFVLKHLKGNGSRLRRGYKFRCLVIPNARMRALVEALAIGTLCPAHIGLGQRVIKGGRS